MNEEEKIIFKQQSLLLKDAVEITRTQISEYKSIVNRLEVAKAEAAVGVFITHSLDTFAFALEYIADKMIDEDERTAYFLSSNVRTLFDIYGNILDLIANHPETRKG